MATTPRGYIRLPAPPEGVEGTPPPPIVEYYTPPSTNGHLPSPISVTVQQPGTYQFTGTQLVIGLLLLYLLLKK